MPVLSTRIVLDCFYLLIFYSEKFSTDVCRLPYAVNVNLNLSTVSGKEGEGLEKKKHFIQAELPEKFNPPKKRNRRRKPFPLLVDH